MVRRASSSLNPLLVVVLAIVLGIVAVGGGWFLYRQISDPYRTIPALDGRGYLENANSLRGNTYKVSGEVDQALAWSPGVGRLFSIKAEPGGELLPVLLPAEFNATNVQRGQRYFMKIEVGDKGILRAQSIEKI